MHLGMDIGYQKEVIILISVWKTSLHVPFEMPRHKFRVAQHYVAYR